MPNRGLRVSRATRDRYQLEQPLFSLSEPVFFANVREARMLA